MNKPDIFTLLRTGHFFFALTRVNVDCHSNVIMSYFCKIKMSGFLFIGVRFSSAKENLHGKGHFEDEPERGR